MVRKVWFLLIMGLFMVTGVGCCPVTRLNISIQLDKSFLDKYGSPREVKVDVVGVKDAENTRWLNYSMTKYWSSTDTQHNTPMLKSLSFNAPDKDGKAPANPLAPQVISSGDPIWDQWLAGASDKHPPQIYVLVQLPGTWDADKDDKPGAEDPRRQIISTSSCQNKRDALGPAPTVHLVILADRVSMQ